jgi:hypothetical protein
LETDPLRESFRLPRTREAFLFDGFRKAILFSLLYLLGIGRAQDQIVIQILVPNGDIGESKVDLQVSQEPDLMGPFQEMNGL